MERITAASILLMEISNINSKEMFCKKIEADAFSVNLISTINFFLKRNEKQFLLAQLFSIKK